MSMMEKGGVPSAVAGDIDKIFQLSLDLICIAGVDGYFKKINPAFTRLLGYSEKELLETPFIEFIHPDDRERTMKEVETQLQGSPTLYFENRYLHKDGSVRWLAWNAQAVIQDGLLYAIARDVTSLKQTEAALRESEGRFRTLVETADDTILLMDMEFNRIYENECSWTSLGYTRGEWENLGPFWERIHPDDVSAVMESMSALFKTGAVNAKYRIRHKDGHYITRLGKSKVVYTDGTPTAVVSILRDITEMEQAAELLRQNELLMNTTQQMAQIGGWKYNVEKHSMVWTDEVYRIHDISRKDIPHGSAEHIEQSLECYDPKDRPVIWAAFRKCVEEGVPYDMEFPFTSVKGRRMWIRTAGHPVFGKGKNIGIAGVVGHIMDITARKAAEEQLHAAKEEAEAATVLKDKFVTLVAHDLRSPLATISMMLNTALANLKGARYSQSEDMIERINVMCETMMEMTVNLLEAARLQSGDIRLTRKICNIKTICDAVIGDLNYLAEKKGIVLKNEVPGDARLHVDKILFQRVVHNLVINALKFSHKDGVVTVFMPGGQKTVLAVKDTGTGIHESLLPDLFKYEVKTTATGTSGERGTGFGLPMSMDIVKAHGGTIWADSQMGKGTAFFVKMPDTKPAVLVADDDENAITTLRSYLENMGVDVLTAKTGTEALTVVHDKAPVLIITDLAMPSMDGLALLQNLKNSKKYSHIPVIIITGNRGIGIRQTAFEHRADDFITKPLSEPDFIPRIGRFISG